MRTSRRGTSSTLCSTHPLRDSLAVMTNMVEKNWGGGGGGAITPWVAASIASATDQEPFVQSARYFYFALPTHPLAVSLWLQSILCCCYLICTSVYCTHSAPSSWRVFKYSVRFVASGIVLQWRLWVPIVSPSGLRGVVPAMAAVRTIG